MIFTDDTEEIIGVYQKEQEVQVSFDGTAYFSHRNKERSVTVRAYMSVAISTNLHVKIMLVIKVTKIIQPLK